MEVFCYNNGSLLQALNPAQNLAPLADQPWASALDHTFADSAEGFRRQTLRRPLGNRVGGGVLYNKAVYDKLGLRFPTTGPSS